MASRSTFQIERVGHLNHVATDHDAAMAAYRDVLGGTAFGEWQQADAGTKNALITLSDTCVELFSAVDEGPMMRWANRHGEGWHSVEWTVPSLADAEAVCAEHGLRLTDRNPLYVFTHPRDGHGMCLEITPAHFPGDPRDDTSIDPQPSYWREEHRLGITGLDRLRYTADDAAASADWLVAVTGADVSGFRDRPGIAGRAVAVSLPGHVVEFVTPAGDGPTSDALSRRGEHLWSVSFRVRDLDAAHEHLRSVGVSTKPGGSEDAVAFDLRGAVFELVT
jgi:4-hydroxyphenylpyruvate dioxygenase-like putative hemolysin